MAEPHPNPTASFNITPAHPQRDLLPIAQLTADAFADGHYVDEISQTYIGNCHYDWDTTRLIWDGEQLVHHWGVWGYPMRLENVQLKVAGVGAVFTLEAYRQQGLMERAARDSLNAMRTDGYDLSVLRGRHYVKYGYVRAWNYVTYKLKASEVPELEVRGVYQLLGPEWMDQIIALYNQTHQGFSGTCVRPTYRMLKAEDMYAYGWFDENDRLTGYLRAEASEDKKTLQCLEAAGDTQQCVAVLGELFRQGEYETLSFFTLPHQHPILQQLRIGACVVEIQYFHNTGWRVRIVNLESTLVKLLPLLESRLQRSRFASWQGELYLESGEQAACLMIDQGRISLCAGKPGQHYLYAGVGLTRLLIGSDEPEEVMRQAEMACTGLATDLVVVLFPNLYPVMSHWDEF